MEMTETDIMVLDNFVLLPVTDNVWEAFPPPNDENNNSDPGGGRYLQQKTAKGEPFWLLTESWLPMPLIIPHRFYSCFPMLP
jgi:hypothetical protein